MNQHDLESYQELYNELYTDEGVKIYDVDVGKMYLVDVTHIYTPHSFYVRPTGYKTQKLRELALLTERLDISEINFGHQVIFYSSKMDGCLRGEVLYIENDEDPAVSHMFAVDEGSIEAVPAYHIWKPNKYQNEPPLTKLCALENCMPAGDMWEPNITQRMQHLLGKQDIIMRVKDKLVDRLVVELHNGCSRDMSTVLTLNGLAIPGNKIVNQIYEYKFETLKAETTMHVKFLIGQPDKFFVAPIKGHRWYLQMQEHLTQYARRQAPIRNEDITENRPAAVITSTHKYERALIQQITVPKRMAEVLLVDTGVILEVNVSLLKPLPMKYLVPPVMGLCCTLDPRIGSPLAFNDLQPGSQYNIRIASPGIKFEIPSTIQIDHIRD